MQPENGEAAFLEGLQKNYARARKLVAESPLTRGLGGVQKGDLCAEIIAASPHLPGEIASLSPEAQRVRVDAELAALRRNDPAAFDGAFTPAFLVKLWRALGAPLAEWQLYSADAMDSDTRRREIRRVRRVLYERAIDPPVFDPNDPPLASPTALKAMAIEAKRTAAAKAENERARAAAASGTISGPDRGALLPTARGFRAALDGFGTEQKE